MNSIALTTTDSVLALNKIQLAWRSIFSAKKMISTGDIITRTGNDFTSESLRMLNRRNQTYSHCGIASIEHDSVFVYHALGGDWNPDQKIRRESFEDFAAPETNRCMGIYSFDFSARQQKKIVGAIRYFYKSGVMFDMHFDLATNDRMYCAEFVYKSLLLAVGDSLKFNISHINQFKFIGVDDIFLQPQCRRKRQIVYN